jgi:hypothetical protein
MKSEPLCAKFYSIVAKCLRKGEARQILRSLILQIAVRSLFRSQRLQEATVSSGPLAR